MYIAKNTKMDVTEYILRESYSENGVYHHRDLLSLTRHPSAYIKYPDGRSFYIDTDLSDQLHEILGTVDYDDLETIFWPYIHPDIKRRYDFVRSKTKPASSSVDHPVVHHTFDKRRLIYLKSGNMNQRKIDAVQEKYFSSLNKKSRDEIEQHFILMENDLPAKELKNYIYVIFNLQRHFTAPFACEMPEAIAPEKVTEHFMADICKINSDKSLWQELASSSVLNDYLKRYVILFFDYEYQNSTYLNDREFEKFNQRRYHRQHTRPVEEVFSEAAEVFGMTGDQLKKMTRRELKKLFRKKAQELHPDKGGKHDRFVELSRIYNELLMKK